MNKIAMSTRMVSIVLASIYAATPTFADDHEHRAHGTHEHGVAQLNISHEGHALQIELESPAMNIVGFEHMPRNSEQYAAIDNAVAQLKKGDALFLFSDAANCSLIEAEVESGLIDSEHKVHKSGNDDGHNDFDASYRFSCSQPELLHKITVGLFKTFPGTKELEVQLISDSGQQRAHLTPSNPYLKF